MDLDPTDAAIVRSLQEDARASLRTIAKKIGVSVPTVSAHLRNLEALGIVRGYRVLLDLDRSATANVALVVKTKSDAAVEVAKRIAGREWACRVLVGRPGWILVDTNVQQPENVSSIVRDLARMAGVAEVQEYVDLRTVKDEPALLAGDRLAANVPCFECKGPIHGEPIRMRRDGRYHYFCCPACQRLYLEKYDRIRTAARRRT